MRLQITTIRVFLMIPAQVAEATSNWKLFQSVSNYHIIKY
jgi:hypothetical protein